MMIFVVQEPNKGFWYSRWVLYSYTGASFVAAGQKTKKKSKFARIEDRNRCNTKRTNSLQ